MDEEHLHDDLRVFRGRNFFQEMPRSDFAVYSLLALSFLLTITLFAVSLSRVSALSSKFHEEHLDRRQNFSGSDLLLFPCGAKSREWEYFDGKCYYFSLSKMNWFKAKEQCEEMRAHLAVIDSYAEQNFITFRTRNERFWIGLTDQNSEGEWEWIDGTDYRHVWVSGKWNDVHCTFECYYVCEKPLPR
ncbi:PREDICTED: hepatic lectin-like [Apaloderma vittatum]|uniref:hepatic lectin-like n=1 Tax=Apaloderma vittatum TaxID=57397 RepID=UPI00052182F1|nr:PREDICTED: hepatic lectin-like [Apaloderma vittatum]